MPAADPHTIAAGNDAFFPPDEHDQTSTELSGLSTAGCTARLCSNAALEHAWRCCLDSKRLHMQA